MGTNIWYLNQGEKDSSGRELWQNIVLNDYVPREEEFDEHYEQIGSIRSVSAADIDHPSQVYAGMTGYDDAFDELSEWNARAISVGDVVGLDEKKYVVMPVGFEELGY